MRLLIVIVNYRSASLTIDCLRSLAPQVAGIPGGVRVVVTDNASGDDSLATLTASLRDNGWSPWASVQPLERNGGFAYGNNQAIAPALGVPENPRRSDNSAAGALTGGGNPPDQPRLRRDSAGEGTGGTGERHPGSSGTPPSLAAGERLDYVLLLNPDTVPRPGAIEALLRFMDEHPRAGIAGSRLEHLDGTPQQSAFRFHSVLSELEGGVRIGLVSRLLKGCIVAMPVPAEACPVDWVAGASMIVRREVFESAGLMDEAYFMYFEEVDFCLTASRAGWPCWYVPESRVVHLVGQTSGVTDRKRANKRRPAYWFDSRRRYFLKNHGRFKTFLADLAWSTGFATFRARQFLQRKPDTEPARLLRDFVQYNFCAGKGQV